MTMKFLTFSILFFTILLSKPSYALAKLGHQIICQLAFEHLPENKQIKITTLLNTIPKMHQELINSYNYQKLEAPVTFANACTWADAVKRIESYKDYNAWHYMNVSRAHTAIKKDDCQKNCVPQAILQHQYLLAQSKNTGKANWEQAQALLFLGHWLGDIHQPLHISFADDLGGNKIEFSHLETKCNNLHWYWDQCILYRGKHSKTKWLAWLKPQWHQQSQPNWQTAQVWQWADESFQIAKKSSVNYCQLNQHGRCQKPINNIKLTPDYLAQHQPIMAQRLLLAAQRLTKVLAAVL